MQQLWTIMQRIQVTSSQTETINGWTLAAGWLNKPPQSIISKFDRIKEAVKAISVNFNANVNKVKNVALGSNPDTKTERNFPNTIPIRSIIWAICKKQRLNQDIKLV